MGLRHRYYRLDDNGKPVRVDLKDADFRNRWKIASNPVDGIRVSTIFTARDRVRYLIGTGPPVLFETMAFEVTEDGLVDMDAESTHPWHEYQERYTTKRRAEFGHVIICAAIKNGQVPDDLQGAWGVDPGPM